LHGFLERLLPFADAGRFPDPAPVALELVPLPLLERDCDRPPLLAGDLDFPAVRPVERGAALLVEPPLDPLLRVEVERLEMLEAPPLGFFFSP